MVSGGDSYDLWSSLAYELGVRGFSAQYTSLMLIYIYVYNIVFWARFDVWKINAQNLSDHKQCNSDDFVIYSSSYFDVLTNRRPISALNISCKRLCSYHRHGTSWLKSKLPSWNLHSIRAATKAIIDLIFLDSDAKISHLNLIWSRFQMEIIDAWLSASAYVHLLRISTVLVVYSYLIRGVRVCKTSPPKCRKNRYRKAGESYLLNHAIWWNLKDHTDIFFLFRSAVLTIRFPN